VADSTLEVLDAVVAKLSELVTGGEGAVTTVTDFLQGYIDPEELPFVAVLVATEDESLRGERNSAEATWGTKFVDYDVQVEVRDLGFLDSQRADTRAFYALIDTIRLKLAADPSLGGLMRRFGLDIQVRFTEPRATEETVHYAASLTTRGQQAVSRAPLG